jgi:hypothetical protein
MSTIEFPVPTRASFVRLLVVMFGVAFVSAAAVLLPQVSASKECQGGAFNSRFSSGFDVAHCDLVVRRVDGNEIVRIRLPREL